MGQTISIPAQYDYTYVHIGIQIPFCQPITYITSGETSPDLVIGRSDNTERIEYRVNETGILEFDDLAENSWRIQFLKNIPMEGIIDIVYDETDI